MLFTGVACLDVFIQCNWTGPVPPVASVLPNNTLECSDQQILVRMSEDGEVTIVNAQGSP